MKHFIINYLVKVHLIFVIYRLRSVDEAPLTIGLWIQKQLIKKHRNLCMSGADAANIDSK